MHSTALPLRAFHYRIPPPLPLRHASRVRRSTGHRFSCATPLLLATSTMYSAPPCLRSPLVPLLPLHFSRSGLARCPGSVPLWRSAARLEEGAGQVARARALLEQARLRNPKTPELWLAAVRTEQRAGNDKAADSMLAKALQVGACVFSVWVWVSEGGFADGGGCEGWQGGGQHAGQGAASRVCVVGELCGCGLVGDGCGPTACSPPVVRRYVLP